MAALADPEAALHPAARPDRMPTVTAVKSRPEPAERRQPGRTESAVDRESSPGNREDRAVPNDAPRTEGQLFFLFNLLFQVHRTTAVPALAVSHLVHDAAECAVYGASPFLAGVEAIFLADCLVHVVD